MLPYHQQIPHDSTSLTPVITQEEQTFGLFKNLTVVQSGLNKDLSVEVEKSSLALQLFREEASNTHQSLIGRVVQLESGRSNYEMRLHEMSLSDEVKSTEYEKRIKTLEAQLSAKNAELDQKNKKIADQLNALSAIKASTEAALYTDSQAGGIYYIVNFEPSRANLINTCKVQLQKLKII